LISRGSAEPGPYRTARTPYLSALLTDLGPTSPVQRVVFKKAAQVGASEAGNCWLGEIVELILGSEDASSTLCSHSCQPPSPGDNAPKETLNNAACRATWRSGRVV
jgi:Phage terminase large subunit (GpA)